MILMKCTISQTCNKYQQQFQQVNALKAPRISSFMTICHLYQELVRKYGIRLVVFLSRIRGLCTTFLSTDLHFVLAKFCFASAGS